MRRITIILLLSIFNFASSQENLKTGFTYLEEGAFSQAEIFFSKILDKEPDNFTAKICYGRAIGLNGNPSLALTHFEQMRVAHPENLEVSLNYAEALLWNRQFSDAKIFYEELLKKHPENSTLLLGYANTLSNLKMYDKAKIYIDKALQQDPENKGFLQSLKYIHLGGAYQYFLAKEYDTALEWLTAIESEFPDDIEVWESRFQNYVAQNDWKNAQLSLSKIPENTDNGQAIKYLNQSLLAHLQHRESQSLQYAQFAYSTNDTLLDKNLKNRINERFIQALIWNKKFIRAKNAIDLHRKDLPASILLQLQTQYHTYRGEFDRVIEKSNQLLALDSTSYVGHMSLYNAQFGNKNFEESSLKLKEIETYFPNDVHIVKSKEKLYKLQAPLWETTLFVTEDSGDNLSYNAQSYIRFPLNFKWELKAQIGHRSTEDFNGLQSQNTDVGIGANWKFSPKWKWSNDLLWYQSNGEGDTHREVLWKSELQFDFMPRSFISIGSQKTPENFNSALSNLDLNSTHFYTQMNLMSASRIGLFAQYYYTTYSDQNQRNLGYASLYYTFGNRPIWKMGLNFQHISFSEQNPLEYFSPSTYSLWEGMMVVESPKWEDKKSQWIYLATIALGQQKIEQNQSQLSQRYRLELGYQFNTKIQIKAYGGYNTTSSGTASGFALTDAGLNFQIYLR